MDGDPGRKWNENWGLSMSIGQKEIFALIKALTGQANILTIPRVFITMTGETDAALLLAQILYWSDRTTDPEGWFYKSAKEWDEELGLSTYKVNRAIKLLAPWGVQTQLKKANGAPTTHYRLDSEQFCEAISKFLQNGFSINSQNGFPKDSQNGFGSSSQMDTKESRKSLTETTPKTTSEITAEITDDVVAALTDLGLTKRQATAAVKRHQLSLDDVAQWRDWKASLKKAGNATAMLAALLKEQRLPPREHTQEQKNGLDQSRDNSAPDFTPESDVLVEVHTPDGLTSTMSIKQIWQNVLDALLGEMPHNEFETWIRPTVLLDVQDESAILGVPYIFVRQELEARFVGAIENVLETILGYSVQVVVVIGT